MRRFLFRPMRLFISLVAAAATAQAGAQPLPYPSRPVSLVVPAAPGGLTDIIGRTFAPALGRAIGQPVVVVNRAGAGGAVGSAAVARADPDGYTVLMGITSLATLPAQAIITGAAPAFTLDELTPVAALSTEPMMLVTRTDGPYLTFKDVLKDARARPGAVAYSTTGVYGTYHVAIEMVAQAVNARLLAVHYQGGGEAMRALLGKDVNLSLVTRSVGLKQLRGGQLRALVAWSESRWPELPDVPSLKDEGVDAGYNLVTGLFVARGTSPATLKSLRDAVRVAIADPEFQATMIRLSATITHMDAPEFGKVWNSESARLAEVVRRMGKLQ